MLQADDAAVPSTVSWHYAVFSLKDGLASSCPRPQWTASRPDRRRRRAPAISGKMPVGRLAAAAWSLWPLAVAPRLTGGPLSPVFWRNPLASHVAQKSLQPTHNAVRHPTRTSLNSATASDNPDPVPQPSSNSGTGASFSRLRHRRYPILNPGQQTQQALKPNNSISERELLIPAWWRRLCAYPTRSERRLLCPYPAKPEVAVIAVGDPLLASPLEDELEKALGGEGIGVVSGSPALDSLRRHRASSPTISEILASLRADGVHAVVIAQVERGGNRELSYYRPAGCLLLFPGEDLRLSGEWPQSFEPGLERSDRVHHRQRFNRGGKRRSTGCRRSRQCRAEWLAGALRGASQTHAVIARLGIAYPHKKILGFYDPR